MHPKAPEFISLFIDEHLKKGLKGVRPFALSFLGLAEFQMLENRG